MPPMIQLLSHYIWNLLLVKLCFSVQCVRYILQAINLNAYIVFRRLEGCHEAKIMHTSESWIRLK